MSAAKADAPKRRLVSRRYGRDGHGYLLDGEKIAGVTTILNALPKSLKQWAADTAANYAVEHWDELSGLPITQRIDRMRYAHRDVVGAAATRGKDIHRYGEALAKGEQINVPDEVRIPVEAYARFLDAWDITTVATEAPIVNATYRYAGTGDLWARIGKRDDALAYIDLKTGKNVYEATQLQCTAYDHAELWQPDGPDSEQPYEQADLVYVAHILPDAVQMLPVVGLGGAPRPGPLDLRAFLYVQQVSQWLDAHGFKGAEPLIENPVRPDEVEHR